MKYITRVSFAKPDCSGFTLYLPLGGDIIDFRRNHVMSEDEKRDVFSVSMIFQVGQERTEEILVGVVTDNEETIAENVKHLFTYYDPINDKAYHLLQYLNFIFQPAIAGQIANEVIQ